LKRQPNKVANLEFGYICWRKKRLLWLILGTCIFCYISFLLRSKKLCDFFRLNVLINRSFRGESHHRFLTLIYNYHWHPYIIYIYHVFSWVPHSWWQLDIHNFSESHILDGIYISHILLLVHWGTFTSPIPRNQVFLGLVGCLLFSHRSLLDR
jgi:hypothetical protein